MTQVRFLNLFHPASVLSAFLLAGLVAGCSSPSHPGPVDNGPRPVAMKGEDKFFDGQVDAVLTITRGFSRGIPHGGKSNKDDETPSLAEVFSTELSDTENKDFTATYQKMQALQVRGSPLPPVILRLGLKSHATAALEVEVLEVNSDLGNFAVRPEKLTLAPDQPNGPDPMNSQLGVTSDEIPVKVAIRANGKTESKIIVVKSLFTGDLQKKQP
jgi:hypothetical protein